VHAEWEPDELIEVWTLVKGDWDLIANKAGVTRQQDSLMGPLAALTCGTLILAVFRPGLIASLVIFFVSAGFGVYQLAANTAFVVRVPADRTDAVLTGMLWSDRTKWPGAVAEAMGHDRRKYGQGSGG